MAPMKRVLTITLLILFGFFVTPLLAQDAPVPADDAPAVDGTVAPDAPADATTPEGPVVEPAGENQIEEEEPLLEGTNGEDQAEEEPLPEEPPLEETGRNVRGPADIRPIEPVEAPAEDSVVGPKKITIDTVVYLSYQFFGSSDAFKVKYHINMGGRANLAATVIKGSAEVATEVTGYLAKWPQGQCMLDVSIAKVPYEINYEQGADEADINVKFKGDFNEKWQSTCTFIGGVTKPFKTEGPVEKWIGEALEKAAPPLTSIVAPLEAGEASTITFTIPEYTVLEEGLGSAEIKGTGIVTVEPIVKKPVEE